MTLQSPTTTLIPLISSSELSECGYSGLFNRKKSFGHVPSVGLPACKASTLFARTGSPPFLNMCMYPSSRNDVPQVAQRYGTIAAYTRCRASVLVVFVVIFVHMYSFAGLIRRMPPPTFSDSAITDRHSDTVPGRFAPNRFPPLDVSPPGRFAPGCFAPTGRFAPWTFRPQISMGVGGTFM